MNAHAHTYALPRVCMYLCTYVSTLPRVFVHRFPQVHRCSLHHLSLSYAASKTLDLFKVIVRSIQKLRVGGGRDGCRVNRRSLMTEQIKAEQGGRLESLYFFFSCFSLVGSYSLGH